MNNISTTTVYRIHLEKGGQQQVDRIFPLGSVVSNLSNHMINPSEIYQLETLLRVQHKDKLYERLRSLLSVALSSPEKSPFIFINSREYRDPSISRQKYAPLSASLAVVPLQMSDRTAVLIDLSSQGKFILDSAKNVDRFSIRDKTLYGLLQMGVAGYQLKTNEENVKTLRKLLMVGAQIYTSLIMRVFNRSFGVTYRTSVNVGSMGVDVYHLLKYAFTYFFINHMGGAPAKTAKPYADVTVGRETADVVNNSNIDVENDLTVANMSELLSFLSSNEGFRKITTKSGDNTFSAVMLLQSFAELYGPHTLFVIDHFLSFVTCIISAYHKMDLNKFKIIESTVAKEDIIKLMEMLASLNRG